MITSWQILSLDLQSNFHNKSQSNHSESDKYLAIVLGDLDFLERKSLYLVNGRGDHARSSDTDGISLYRSRDDLHLKACSVAI